MSETISYLYGVTRAPHTDVPAAVDGVAGTPTRVLAIGDLSAVVGSVDAGEFGADGLRRHLEDLDWLERTARHHDAVVGAVAERAPVVPLRLATVYLDDDRVRRAVGARAGDFRTVLDRITGCDEWGVKVFADEPTADTAPRGTAPGGTAPSGTDHLRRLSALRRERAQAGEQRAVDAAEVDSALTRYAREVRRHPPQNRELAGYRGQMLLNQAFLVPADAGHGFHGAFESLQRRFPALRMELTGPWPAYSFARLPGEES